MSQVEPAEIPWSEAVVMVCTKCSRKIVGDEALADSMKKALKSAFKEAGLGKSVRTVTSSCLDVCPKDRVTVAVLTRDHGTKAITVEPDIKDTALFAEVRRLALP